MIFELLLTPEAETEFRQAVEWYDQRQPGLGQRFSQAFRILLRRATNDPEKYRSVSQLTRKVRLPKWPYSIYFTIAQDHAKVVVVAIFHDKRNPEQLRARLG